MRIEPVSIPVDLSLFDDTNQLELVFETEVGRVCVFVNIIEEIYLPKQQVNVNKSLSNSGSSNNQIGSQEALQSSIESYR